MNERIREIVNKAISDVDYIRDDDFTNEELSKMYIPDCFAEKFAELIVRECAYIVDQPYDFKTPPDQKTYRYPLSGDEVLKHFGVEE